MSEMPGLWVRSNESIFKGIECSAHEREQRLAKQRAAFAT